MDSTFTIRLSDDLRKALDEIAQQQNCSPSDVASESVRRYIAVQKFRKSRAMTLPFAEAQGYLTDEDVFDTIS